MYLNFLLLIMKISSRSICSKYKFFLREKVSCLPFLDVHIFLQKEKFKTKVHRKKDLQWVIYQLQKLYTSAI